MEPRFAKFKSPTKEMSKKSWPKKSNERPGKERRKVSTGTDKGGRRWKQEAGREKKKKLKCDRREPYPRTSTGGQQWTTGLRPQPQAHLTKLRDQTKNRPVRKHPNQ